MPTTYKSTNIPTWCPGCPDYLLFAGINQALSTLGWLPHQVVIAFDIGCIGNMADFFKVYGIHTLHGRAIPVALGVKMANPLLHVLVVGGDGGIYGEGLNHLIAASRLNLDLKVIVANNCLYSLTTGQTSPTTPFGAKTKSTPSGNPNQPLNAVEMIKTVNPQVFACTIASSPTEIAPTLVSAFQSPNFALIDVRQTCATFGKQLS
jgi:2-oxoglutarate ferredoxin oxidoreductase subunit beta